MKVAVCILLIPILTAIAFSLPGEALAQYRAPGPEWRHPLDASPSFLRMHLANEHGYDMAALNRLSYNALRILHSNTHNGYRSIAPPQAPTAYVITPRVYQPSICTTVGRGPIPTVQYVFDPAPIVRAQRVLWFYADWCAPCRNLKTRLLPQLIDKGWRCGKTPDMDVQLVEVDTNKSLAATYGVTQIPTIVLIGGPGGKYLKLTNIQTLTPVILRAKWEELYGW